MKARTAAMLVALLLALTGCAGLPTAGPVNPGLGAAEAPDVPDFSFSPDRPQPGATPEQIVEGFVAAATGSQNDWEIAQLFLAPAIRESWRPEAGVTIDRPGSRTVTAIEDGRVEMSVVVTASVDENGAYELADEPTQTFSYGLAEQADGQWRITEVPDGIVLDEDNFDNVFRAYSLMYFDPSWNYLVPDVRWFATRNPATRITRALLGSTPSPWLQESVASAAPEGVSLARQSVPVVQGVARIELTEAALDADPVTLGRLQRQLQASLQGAGIAGAEMLVDGAALTVEPAPVRGTAIDARPLVLTDDVFGFLSDGEVARLGGMSATIESLGVTAVSMGRGEETAAVSLTGGGVARVDADGEATTVDPRAGLAEPALDPDGVIWTVPRDQPTALRATLADGTAIDIEGAWVGSSRVQAIQISRDGTRMAAILTAGGRDWAVVSGIVRDADGVPRSLGESRRIVRLDGSGIDVAWLDDQTLGIASAGDDGEMSVIEHVVGGTGQTLSGPAATLTTIAAGATVTSARVLSDDGVLSLRRGSTWQPAAEGVRVLAPQLGAASG
ncbi:MAG: hypothetical protein DI573_02510 [Microbacterium sp.]|jgi:hypothetical protein|uniref:LpqB family beta-propeller domain-containing protein n=1 Tax=Microbacterium sp. TaxID=51671 RepID=UPI000DB5493F|nr:LpqB family beta-propeller domain-containing protein [Microbacterium sp.]PZU40894.1 MAG: hypothetical protein DI573_02510 [Microbacterium sp.]